MDTAAMDVHLPLPRALLWQWHFLHFWDSLLFNGEPNALTEGRWSRMRSRLEAAGKEYGSGRVVELPRVTGLSPAEFYANYVVPNRPVVLAGAARDWKCVREWTPEYLAERYGHFNIMTVEGKDWTPAISASIGMQEHRLADLIADIRRGGKRYASFYPLFRFHPELLEDLDVRWLERHFRARKMVPWQRRAFPKLFLGGPGTSTTTHCAGILNLFVQIYGEKQWDLWNPAAAPFLYPEFRIANNMTSLVDFRNPDYQQSPLFRHPDRFRTVLQPGDILFVPAWWWHAVTNLTTTISVSNFVGRLRSSWYGNSFCVRALMDPWTIAVFVLANEDAEEEWEVSVHKVLYAGSRKGYTGTLANFKDFVMHSLRERRRLGARP
jgi:hypothetical protein